MTVEMRRCSRVWGPDGRSCFAVAGHMTVRTATAGDREIPAGRAAPGRVAVLAVAPVLAPLAVALSLAPLAVVPVLAPLAVALSLAPPVVWLAASSAPKTIS